MILIIRISLPEEGFKAYEIYEAQALALVAAHGGEPLHILRHLDGSGETHVISFPDVAAYRAYRTDAGHGALAPQLAASGARIVVQEARSIDHDHSDFDAGF